MTACSGGLLRLLSAVRRGTGNEPRQFVLGTALVEPAGGRVVVRLVSREAGVLFALLVCFIVLFLFLLLV